MSNNRITPFVKRMRTNGGTIYTFSSAVEDIGLNINERNNVVKISHFALLDIPQINFDSGDLDRNFFNIKAIAGAFEYEAPSASIKDGRVLIAESFQNYALNLENNLLNRKDYDPTLIRTVTERVFWKWLKETGSIRFDKDVSVGTSQYWGEELDADGSLGYNRVVKYIGRVSAGNVRTDSFGTYNETYVLVPTSHGQTDAYFQIVEDDNYKHGMEIGDLGEKILGRDTYTLPHPDGLSYLAYYDFVDSSTWIVGPTEYTLQYDNSSGVWSDGWWYTAQGVEPSSTDNAYLTDSSLYLSTGIYHTDLRYIGGSDDFDFRRSKVDCLSLVWDLDKLKGIYSDSALTYDKMAIQYAINDNFNFNAVLVYYTVYNSTEDEVLGRNLLGVLFIDAPSGNSSEIGIAGITIPSLEKIMSGPGGFGTSYSLRLNIKTDNMVDDTGATIVDQATSDQLYAEDWTAAFANLNTAVNLLTQNTGTIQYLSGQYIEVQTTQTQILNDLQALQWQVNDIGRDITGTPNVLTMFADGDDKVVDSSIYMKFGNVGIKNNDPKYPLHVSGTTKVDEIIIENAVKDTSGNVLLGYGSPLQIGSSTNYREVAIYTGGNDPAVYIDSSSHIDLEGDVSISGGLEVIGDTIIKGSVTFDGSISSPSFNFNADYFLPGSQTGIGLQWDSVNKYLSLQSDTSTLGVFYLNELLDVSLADGSLGPAQDGSALIYDYASRRWTYGVASGGGGTGDVAWASENVGSNNQIITANGDGSIVAESGILFSDGVLQIGNDPVQINSDSLINLSNDSSIVEMRFNRTDLNEAFTFGFGCDQTLNQENIYLRWLKQGGAGLPKTYLEIDPNDERFYTRGELRPETLYVDGSVKFTQGGNEWLYFDHAAKKLYFGDYKATGEGLLVEINGQYGKFDIWSLGDGSIFSIDGNNVNIFQSLETTIVSANSLSSTIMAADSLTVDGSIIANDIPIGTPDTSEYLFVDISDGNRIKRALIFDASYLAFDNGADNRIVTAGGASSIRGESNLTFDTSTLEFDGAQDMFIQHKPYNDTTAFKNNTLFIKGSNALDQDPSSYTTQTYAPTAFTPTGTGAWNHTLGTNYTYTGFPNGSFTPIGSGLVTNTFFGNAGDIGGDLNISGGKGANASGGTDFNRGGTGGDVIINGGPGGTASGAGSVQGLKGNVHIDGTIINLDADYVDVADQIRLQGDPITRIDFGSGSQTMSFHLRTGVGGNVEYLTLHGANPGPYEVVVNESGSTSLDFRVESDVENHMLFVDSNVNKLQSENADIVKAYETIVADSVGGDLLEQTVFSNTSITHARYIRNPGKKMYRLKFYVENNNGSGSSNTFNFRIKKGTTTLYTESLSLGGSGAQAMLEFNFGASTTSITDVVSNVARDGLGAGITFGGGSHGTGNGISLTIQNTTESTYTLDIKALTLEVLDS